MRDQENCHYNFTSCGLLCLTIPYRWQMKVTYALFWQFCFPGSILMMNYAPVVERKTQYDCDFGLWLLCPLWLWGVCWFSVSWLCLSLRFVTIDPGLISGYGFFYEIRVIVGTLQHVWCSLQHVWWNLEHVWCNLQLVFPWTWVESQNKCCHETLHAMIISLNWLNWSILNLL